MTDETAIDADDTPDTDVPPATPIIRDPAHAILALRKENAHLRQSANDKADARADRRIEEHRIAAEAAATAAVEQKFKDRLIQSELRAHFAEAGSIDHEDTLTILQSGGFEPEIDSEGNVTNATAALARLKIEKPYLFRRSGGDNARSPIAAPAPEPAAPKRPVDMSPSEYEAAKARLCNADDPHRAKAQVNRRFPGAFS